MFQKLFGRTAESTDTIAPTPAPTADQDCWLPVTGERLEYDLRRDDDFTTITSAAEVKRVVDEGRLEMVYLVHPRFGGFDGPANLVPMSPGAQDVMEGVNDELAAALAAGREFGLEARMEYDSDSHVPNRIVYDLAPMGTIVLNNW